MLLFLVDLYFFVSSLTLSPLSVEQITEAVCVCVCVRVLIRFQILRFKDISIGIHRYYTNTCQQVATSDSLMLVSVLVVIYLLFSYR